MMSRSESAGKTANKCPGNSSELSIPVKVNCNKKKRVVTLKNLKYKIVLICLTF